MINGNHKKSKNKFHPFLAKYKQGDDTVPHLTKQELTLIKQSILQEKELIALYQTVAQKTNDPVLRGKWQESAAAHHTHLNKLKEFLE